jgi:hypothetical protein
MHLVLRILKLDILRVPPIQVLTMKGSTLSFVQQISQENKPKAIFGNYIQVRKTEKKLKILKFDILKVPYIQIPPKKGKNLEFCSANLN